MKIKIHSEVDQSLQPKVISGVNKLANIVKKTLGPKGKLVVIEESPYAPLIITQDGVTVAKHFGLEDKYENLGVRVVQQVSSKTDDKVGDGTTSATVLTQAILAEATSNSHILGSSTDTVSIRHEIEHVKHNILEKLDSIKKEITTPEDVYNVAYVSSLDEEISGLIKDAYVAVGKKGLIQFEKGRNTKTTLEITKGLEIPTGYASSHFINRPDGTFEYEDTYILVTNDKMDNISKIKKLVDNAIKELKINRLIILADSFDTSFLRDCIANKKGGTFDIMCIKTPGIGENNRNYCKDVALVLGAKFIDLDTGATVEEATPRDLGFARIIRGSWNKTTFIEGKGDKAKIEEAIEDLKKLAEVEVYNQLIKERMARLDSGVALIKIGAPTETELNERKDKVQDAVNAVKAALEEGVVAGGGYTLALIGHEIEAKNQGERIMKTALSSPLREIAENAGYAGDLTLKECMEKKLGFNAKIGMFEDLLANGVIDPVKVTKNVVINAVSAALQVMNIEGAIVKEKIEQLSDLVN